MHATLMIHVEPADTESGVTWWAESPDLEGFYVVADTLAQMRSAALDAIQTEWGDVEIRERLTPDGQAGDGDRSDATVTLVPAA